MNKEHNPNQCITFQDYLDGVWKQLKDEGDIPEGLELDYVSLGGFLSATPMGVKPDEYRLTSYEFNLVPTVDYGGSEGIYIDIEITGKFDVEQKDYNNRLRAGTIKTLQDNKETMMKMGELCGALVYHSHKFVNSRIDEFDGSMK